MIEYPNGSGQVLRGIISRTGASVGAPVVVIPPAWGRTKETPFALANLIVRAYEKAGESIVVVRFDGTNRRGESYIDPENRTPGHEYLGFTFSQAVRDIEATLDFFEQSPDFRTQQFVLVTFSLGSIEGRRALAQDSQRRIVGWVSVVGMTDLQSGLRTVSGGVDYAYGLMRGVSFGCHELVGVLANMDLTGADALRHRLVFAEDARRDMAKVTVPVTWIHGRYDAWMDLERVRELLSAGDSSRRRLLEVPSGHQMRNSREALETFQLVAQEVSSMLGNRLEPALPDIGELERTRSAERARRRLPPVDLRKFWRDYLLGRDRRFGIELMTSTSAYGDLMALQTELLDLSSGQVVVDLGSGIGDFSLWLRRMIAEGECVRIIELDYVTQALARARGRRNGSASGLVSVVQLAANLEMTPQRGIPLRAESADAVIASLLISYVHAHSRLLDEIFKLLRSGGRLVLSTLRRDADISRIYVDGVSELAPDRVNDHFGTGVGRDFPSLQRSFLNDAARLIDLEEAGLFRFWDAEELTEAVRKAGFHRVETRYAFGEPGQALVLSARRP